MNLFQMNNEYNGLYSYSKYYSNTTTNITKIKRNKIKIMSKIFFS